MSEQDTQDGQIHSKGIDFVSHVVSDINASVSFYRDTLGLVLEVFHEDGETGFAEFAAPPTTLALVEANDQTASPGEGGATIALAVDDVETATEVLRDGGMAVHMEPVETGVCQMATVTDPDGNLITLHKRDDGTHGRVDPFP